MSNGDFDTLDNLPTIQDDDGKDKLLASRYKIIRKLGEGGMGLVYLAEDTELSNNKVAIKFIPPQLAGNARAIKNLKKEAKTSMQLSHPNIVRLHDLHTDGHQKFLVMEYIDGKTLDDVLAEKDEGKLTLDELLPIAEQIALGLDFAHSKKVLHRDLKPSNIMIDKSSTVKLLDFGIAREMKDSYTRVTGQETSGTLPYMSPEQLRGQPPSASMDIYSFAAVLYECLCGNPPFYTGDLRHQILEEKPSEVVGIPEYANKALPCALAKNPAQRPKASVDLIAMLKGKKKATVYKDTLDYAKTIDGGEIRRHKGPWWKLFAVLAVLLLIGIGAALAIFGYSNYRQQQEKNQTALERLHQRQITEKVERKKQEEQVRQAELLRQQETARQAELLRQQETARQAEQERQQKEARQAELLRQQEAARQAEQERQQKKARQAELLRQQEAAHRRELARQLEEQQKEHVLFEHRVDSTTKCSVVLKDPHGKLLGRRYLLLEIENDYLCSQVAAYISQDKEGRFGIPGHWSVPWKDIGSITVEQGQQIDLSKSQDYEDGLYYDYDGRSCEGLVKFLYLCLDKCDIKTVRTNSRGRGALVSPEVRGKYSKGDVIVLKDPYLPLEMHIKVVEIEEVMTHEVHILGPKTTLDMKIIEKGS